jgi:hypothetical protein
MYWFAAIGCPNASRFLANSMQRSSRRCISPTIMMKMQRISQFMTCSRMKKPCPTFPITLPAGTRQSLNSSSPIGDVPRPIFGIGSPTLMPGLSVSTRKAVMPVAPPSPPSPCA